MTGSNRPPGSFGAAACGVAVMLLLGACGGQTVPAAPARTSVATTVTAPETSSMSSMSSAPSGPLTLSDSPAPTVTSEPETSPSPAATSGVSGKVYLADLDTVEREDVAMGPNEVNSNGQSFVKAVSLFKPAPGRSALGYDTGRRYARFTAVLGLTDDSDSGAKQRFEVYGDGRRLSSVDVAFGQSKPVDVPIRGVLRLRLVVTSLANDKRCTAVWADAAVA